MDFLCHDHPRVLTCNSICFCSFWIFCFWRVFCFSFFHILSIALHYYSLFDGFFYLCLPTFLRCSLWSCCWLLQRYQNTTTTLGVEVLLSRGLFVHGYWYWIGIGALLGFVVLFNSLFIMAITFLDRMFFLPATILHTFFFFFFFGCTLSPNSYFGEIVFWWWRKTKGKTNHHCHFSTRYTNDSELNLLKLLDQQQ